MQRRFRRRDPQREGTRRVVQKPALLVRAPLHSDVPLVVAVESDEEAHAIAIRQETRIQGTPTLHRGRGYRRQSQGTVERPCSFARLRETGTDDRLGRFRCPSNIRELEALAPFTLVV